MIGSSRVLKALADDDLFGPLLRFVKTGQTKSGNPIAAVLVTFVIAEVSVQCLNKNFLTVFFSLSL
jgi:amino acid permease